MAPTTESKTDLALTRTVLAVERTFNAWIKTGIGFLAGGLGFFKLMEDQLAEAHGMLILLAAALLIVVAMLITGYATHRYRRRMSELGKGIVGRWPTSAVLFIGTSFLAVCVVSLACLWML